MQKNLPIALLALIVIFSSFISPEKFSTKGVSFSFPDDWRITGQQDMDGHGYGVTCERQGEAATGIVVIEWLDWITDEKDMLQTSTRKLKEKYGSLPMKMEISAIGNGSFGSHACKQVNYTCSANRRHLNGTFRCFHSCGKTFIIMAQELEEETKDDRNGFRTIEQSFRCK